MPAKQGPIDPDSYNASNSIADAIFHALAPRFDPVIAVSAADPSVRKLTGNAALGPVTLTAEQFAQVVAAVAKAGFSDAAGQFSRLLDVLGLGEVRERGSDGIDLSTVPPAGAV